MINSIRYNHSQTKDPSPSTQRKPALTFEERSCSDERGGVTIDGTLKFSFPNCGMQSSVKSCFSVDIPQSLAIQMHNNHEINVFLSIVVVKSTSLPLEEPNTSLFPFKLIFKNLLVILWTKVISTQESSVRSNRTR